MCFLDAGFTCLVLAQSYGIEATNLDELQVTTEDEN